MNRNIVDAFLALFNWFFFQLSSGRAVFSFGNLILLISYAFKQLLYVYSFGSVVVTSLFSLFEISLCIICQFTNLKSYFSSLKWKIEVQLLLINWSHMKKLEKLKFVSAEYGDQDFQAWLINMQVYTVY